MAATSAALVVLVEVGVRHGEVGDGLLERRLLAEVRRDRDPVARAGVRPRQRPGAQQGVLRHAHRRHELGRERQLPVAELAQVEVAAHAVDPLLALPPQEDVAVGLHEALAVDDPLAVVALAPPHRLRPLHDGPLPASLACRISGSPPSMYWRFFGLIFLQHDSII